MQQYPDYKYKETYDQIDREALREVSNASLPPDLKPKVGMQLGVQAAGRGVLPVKVAEVKEDSIVVDLSHPLAGKTLTFNVKVVSIE